jgi:hypothetical protein
VSQLLLPLKASSFALYWSLSVPIQYVSLTFQWAESFWRHLVWNSYSSMLVFLDPRSHCLALCCIHFLPLSWLLWHLENPSPHCSQANVWYPKSIQMRKPQHIRLDRGWFSWFIWYLIL